MHVNFKATFWGNYYPIYNRKYNLGTQDLRYPLCRRRLEATNEKKMILEIMELLLHLEGKFRQSNALRRYWNSEYMIPELISKFFKESTQELYVDSSGLRFNQRWKLNKTWHMSSSCQCFTIWRDFSARPALTAQFLNIFLQKLFVVANSLV